MPAPSPATNPSRSLSNGREAFAARRCARSPRATAMKPPMPSSVMVASRRPLIITSTSPCCRWRTDSPMAWLPVAQAETGAKFTPAAP